MAHGRRQLLCERCYEDGAAAVAEVASVMGRDWTGAVVRSIETGDRSLLPADAWDVVDPATWHMFEAHVIARMWARGRQVYRFDHDLAEAIAETPAPDAPLSALEALPYPALFVEAPLPVPDGSLTTVPTRRAAPLPHGYEGFFCVLDGKCLSVSLVGVDADGDLADWSLSFDATDSFEGAVAGAAKRTRAWESGASEAEWRAMIADSFGRALSLLAYLASDRPDVRPAERPFLPAKRSKRRRQAGPKPPDPTVWEVGYVVGPQVGAAARLGAAEAPGSAPGGGQRRSPRPHMRRGHWRHVPYGPREEGLRRLRWIAPTAVLGGAPEGVSTVHEVR